ncbi:MAG: AAA domain-containing protein [Chloroflexi bacterium]|nr:AAA domain-containing protein [Chloroflexota bacterium]
MLRWHYRSRDERLIAFSNRYFYRNQLVTFPSSHQDAPDRGVEFIRVLDGIYDRGGSRTNRIEARRVVDLIVEHAEQRPKETLGVVAFSSAQWLAIHQEWEARRRLRSDLEDFFKEDRDEPFFIKNLEEIQGDERDVIIFSMGYAKDGNGKMSSTFGPVNRVGGERRLNVAVTRARNQVKFVASVRPEEIDLSGSSSEGAKMLVRYMEYAQKGLRALDGAVSIDGRDPESPFEEAVVDELRRRGFRVEPQVGCSGYRIDIGVVDEKNPGRFILGIECDGATYHSSKTARDRDRLRQQLLEDQGWRIHRIWSQDWVKDPDRETRRVLEAIEQARRVPPAMHGGSALTEDISKATREPKQENRPSPRTLTVPKPQVQRAVARMVAYQGARLPRQRSPESFYEEWVATSIVPSLVAACVEAESPVHIGRVTTVVAGCWGFQRAGSKIAAVVDRGIRWAEREKQVVRRGDFLWTPTMTFDQVPARRPEPGKKPRPIEEVALEELGKVALFVVEESFSLPLDDLVIQTSRLLRYERTGNHISDRVREAINLLEQQQRIANTDGMVSLPAQGRSTG